MAYGEWQTSAGHSAHQFCLVSNLLGRKIIYCETYWSIIFLKKKFSFYICFQLLLEKSEDATIDEVLSGGKMLVEEFEPSECYICKCNGLLLQFTVYTRISYVEKRTIACPNTLSHSIPIAMIIIVYSKSHIHYGLVKRVGKNSAMRIRLIVSVHVVIKAGTIDNAFESRHTFRVTTWNVHLVTHMVKIEISSKNTYECEAFSYQTVRHCTRCHWRRGKMVF